jgi:hypothetical protein
MATAKVVKISTTITRRYGAITTSWGMEDEVTVSGRSDLLREYARMHDHIKAAMIDFESATLPRLPLPHVKEEGPTQGLPEAEKKTDEKIGWFPLEAIYVEGKKGQKFYYAKTSYGPFMRHGAPLYWDSFQGMNLDTFEAENVGGWMKFDADQFRVRVIKRNEKYYAQAVSHKDKVKA